MSDRKSTFVVLPAVATALVLLGAYVGAYYRMVEVPDMRPFEGEVAADYSWSHESVPRNPSRSWRRFFAPVHWLDRRIRPHVWR